MIRQLKQLQSTDIPQADSLDKVVRAVEAVHLGIKNSEVAKYIGAGARQGPYYLHATRILGFTDYARHRAHANITDLGSQLVSEPSSRTQILRNAILQAEVTRWLFIAALSDASDWKDSVTDEELVRAMGLITRLNESTCTRRVGTITRWLRGVGLLLSRADGKQIKYLVDKDIFSWRPYTYIDAVDTPLIASRTKLRPYNLAEVVKERVTQDGGSILIMVDQAKRERASQAHQALVELVAVRIVAAGAKPEAGVYVDLTTEVGDGRFIFEMKSITEENARAQVRSGIAQLYEYAYWQSMPEALLVLVVGGRLPAKLRWMEEYLEDYRNIHLICVKDNQLHASKRTRQVLSFLW